MLESLFELALKKNDLKVAFQVRALQAKIFNHWQNKKELNIQNLSEKELEQILEQIKAITHLDS